MEQTRLALRDALEAYLNNKPPVRVAGASEDAFVVLPVRDAREVELAKQLWERLSE
jgi:hypothetical protein